jgi:hypothetical protein
MLNNEIMLPNKNFFKNLHYLSLDVVIGVMASSWMFWRMPNGITKPDVLSLLILGICTWIIYILDRLFDNIKTEPQDARHQFHFQYQYYLQVTIIILFFVALSLVFFLPQLVIYFGVGLSFFLLIYYIVLKNSSQNANYQYFKEIFTAMIYSLSVVGTAFSSKQNLALADYWIGFNFFLLVHQSIFVFSYYEAKTQPKVKNLATKLNKKNCIYLIISICVFIALSNFITAAVFAKKVIIIETFMSVCSVLIFVFQDKLAKNEKYRWLGEMVFWLPILLIFF